MKHFKTAIIFFIALIIIIGTMLSINTTPHQVKSYTKPHAPSKWHKVAAKRVSERYPTWRIYDAQYDTQRSNNDGTLIDTFTFTLVKNLHEKNLNVYIKHRGTQTLLDAWIEELD
ncbi:hypothetical protein A374_18414 [Fictibacillus macauensis ZFHKF-1]|uniref:Uncharacterized protein n=1 Tax=Fictibacillus macauensis ZFHKF-1 TaxID=1196324 RepID=I8AER2_9BACL|nr:DUF3889 domain-containing protein [Fictibacillus macauensis]EIT83829.1 hypothetical protein A374_18414 [Fictibacillus macauensis ZFHKF-1]